MFFFKIALQFRRANNEIALCYIREKQLDQLCKWDGFFSY